MDRVSNYLIERGFIMTEDAIFNSSTGSEYNPESMDILKICKAYLEDYKDIELNEGAGREIGNGYKCIEVKLPLLEKDFCEQLVNIYTAKTNGIINVLTPVIVDMIYNKLLPKYISSSKNLEVVNIDGFTNEHQLAKVWVGDSYKYEYNIKFITVDGYYGYMSVGGDPNVVYKYYPYSLDWDEHKYGGIKYMYVY
jgi:hypothetical protein